MTTTSTAGAWLIVICAFAGLIGMQVTLYLSQRPSPQVRRPQREMSEAQALRDRAPAPALQRSAQEAAVTTSRSPASESALANPVVGPARGPREGAKG